MSRWTMPAACATRERGERLPREDDRVLLGEAPPRLQEVGERAPLDELHREVPVGADLPEVVDLDDPRVVQPRGGPRLLEEALDVEVVLGELLGEELQRDVALERDVPRPEDASHPAPSQLLQDLVAPERPSGADVFERHRRRRLPATPAPASRGPCGG